MVNRGRPWLTMVNHFGNGQPWSTMVSRIFIRFDHGQPWTTMADQTMVNHGQDNDFIMVFDG